MTFSLQSKVYQIGVIFCQLSILREWHFSFNFLEIPTHLHFSLNYVCMHVANSDGFFLPNSLQINCTYSGKYSCWQNTFLLLLVLTRWLRSATTKKGSHSRDSRPFTFTPIHIQVNQQREKSAISTV